MEIAQIGNILKLVKSIPLSSRESLLDYDLIFLDPNFISQTNGNYNKDTIVTVGLDTVKDLHKRKNDIKEFVDQGKLLFVITPFQQEYYFNSSYRISSYSLIPFNISTTHAEGTKIKATQNHIVGGLLERYLSNISYRAYFKESLGTPIAYANVSNQCVSVACGNVIFIPQINKLGEKEKEFLDNLKKLYEPPISKVVDVLPEWSNKYLLPNEGENRQQLESLRLQKEDIEKKIVLTQAELSQKELYKTLFAGTGDALEVIVKKIFTELGFELIETDFNRDDIIAKWKDRIMVVEIKGVAGSSGERQAAQLEKWVSEYHIQNDIRPKGLLLVNGFKDKELNKRTEPVFPNQMLQFSQGREHCLMTGLQLLGLYYDTINNPEKKEELIDTLFTTIGVYQGYGNWTGFIELSK